VKPDDFAYFTKYIYDQTGLVLGPDKMYLIESRLAPLARKWNVATIDLLVGQLRASRDPVLQRDVVDAMMTNESFFFRDGKPFDQFRQLILPALLQARAAKKSFRIWCAAASTGQEPYTLAMILKEEAAKLAGWRVDIVGTDISHEALERAKAGVYTQFEVQRGLPITLLVKYFKQQGDKWEIAPEIRSAVFDVVFCRNVLIYFDQKTKGQILDRMAKLMPADGVLYLGGAETVLGVTERFQPMPGQRGIYQVVAPGGAAKTG
jgi:chemotaxis protein methyltransferase CheR